MKHGIRSIIIGGLVIALFACDKQQSQTQGIRAMESPDELFALSTSVQSGTSEMASTATSDEGILRVLIESAKISIENIKLEIENTLNNVNKQPIDSVNRMLSELNRRLDSQIKYLLALETDLVAQESAIASYKESKADQAIAEVYKSMSCTDVERKITFGIFSSDYERMIANRKQRECNVQADALIRQGWLIKYQGLTCNEKEVVLNSTGSVFESEDEKDFLAAQVNACKEAVAYDAVVQKFSQKTCSELEGLLALRDQSLSYQELRAIKEVFHKNCLASY